MSAFSISLLSFIVVSGLCFSPSVRSDYKLPIIRLPGGEDSGEIGSRNDGDICARTVAPSCPVNCFRTNPVCGVDGVTYWCGCADALCAGTRVAKLGFCEVGNGGSGPVSGQALLLVHIVWLILLGFSVLFGLL
uniref:Serine-type endopeptidase inhibitor n=1 Tax=Davidia involucrata TaxID=16924 RepID=A0A5B7CBW9_DAVIN